MSLDSQLFDPETEEGYIDRQRVTNEVIDTQVTQAEKGTRRPWLKPGGKSLSRDGSHSPAIRVVLPRQVKTEVEARAKAANMSTSKWVRRVLEETVTAQKTGRNRAPQNI